MARSKKHEAIAQEPAAETLTVPAELREPGDDTEPPKKKLPDVEIKGWAHDNNAGVQHLTYTNRTPDKKLFETWLKFRDGKPSDEVRGYIKENGFTWHGDVPEAGAFKGKGAWTHPIGFLSGNTDRALGEKVYKTVVGMILKEKGLEPSPQQSNGVPF